MNGKILKRLLAAGLATTTVAAVADPVSTAFTYQGELRVAGQPASTPYDFEFALFNVASAGSAIATVTRENLVVNSGLFATELDYTELPFAAAQDYWLEVRVRDGASTGVYTPLLPRQKLTPAPYALNARTVQGNGVDRMAIAAGAVDGSKIAEGSVGTTQILNSSVAGIDLAASSVGPSQLADSAVQAQHLETDAVVGDKIASAAIETRHIADGAVQFGDLAVEAVRSTTILDRTIAGVDIATNAIDSLHITDGSVIGIDIAPGSLNGSRIAPDSINGTHIESAAIGADELATDAVRSSHIAADAVKSDEIDNFAVHSDHIQDGQVFAVDLALGAVGTPQLAAGAIGPAQLQNQAVGTAQLAPAAVGTAQIQDGAVGTLALAAAAIEPVHLSNGAVTGSKIAGGAVTSVHIAAAAVEASHLAVNAVQNNALGAAVVTGDKIANGTIPASKLAFAAGYVTAVNAGVGLTGGGSAGDLTLAVNTATIQARVLGSCPIGQYFRGINSDGSVSCEPVPGVPSIATVFDPAFDVGLDASMAIGGDGYPVIAYRSVPPASLSRLEVAKCSNSACTGTVTISVVDDPANAVGFYTSIAIGSDGNPVISYHDASALALKVAKCSDAACTTATVTALEDSASNLGRFTAIAVGNDGLPVIAYSDATAGALKLAKCSDSACTGASFAVVDDPANTVGVFNAVALGSGDLPLIAYHDDTADTLKAAHCATTSCSPGSVTVTTIDDPANSVGSHTSVAIGTDGVPMISYRDNTASALKVLRCANVSCTLVASTTTLDDTANLVGDYSSIAIGPDNLPVIGYQDISVGAVKVAKCANSACTASPSITVVDDHPVANLGSHTMLRLGRDGLPVISYQNSSAQSLKVAKCGTRSCQ